MNEVKIIKLYGDLGEKFGRVHRLAVASAAEAVRALVSQIPGFRAYVERPGAAYQVRLSGRTVDPERELARETTGTIALVPVIEGGKNGLFQTILGVALIVVAWWNPMGWAASGALMSQATLYGMGASMLLGGISQMLAPVPQLNDTMRKDDPSYAFGGVINTTQQGGPVPIVYGQHLTGSTVVAVGMWAEAIPV